MDGDPAELGVACSSYRTEEWGTVLDVPDYVGREGYYSLQSGKTARSRGGSCSLSLVANFSSAVGPGGLAMDGGLGSCRGESGRL